MSTSSRLADALLSSPIPPPHWLDPRFYDAGWVAPRASYSQGPSYVSARVARAELDALASCVNPPVVQGWAWCMAIFGAALMLLGFAGMNHQGHVTAQDVAMVVLPMPAWFLAILVGGFFSHDVELRDREISVRRWTDVWFGRKGRLVGSRSRVHAALSCGSHLQLEGEAGVVVVSMAMWPSSSRQALEERFESWEIELEFPGRHHVHHPQHWNHGHHRMSHRLPEQGRRRSSGS